MRLFEPTHKQIFNRVTGNLSGRVLAGFSDPMTRRLHATLLAGATRASSFAIVECPTLKRRWGRGDNQKAWRLLKVTMLAMASRWYRKQYSQTRSYDDHLLWRLTAANNIFKLLGDPTEAQTTDFEKMDDQFNFDQDILIGRLLKPDKYPKLFVEPWLVYIQCHQALGSPVSLNLDGTSFPIAKPVYEAFADNKGLVETMASLHPTELMLFPTALTEGLNGMTEYFQEALGNPAFDR